MDKNGRMSLKALQLNLLNVSLELSFIYKIDNLKLVLESLRSNSDKKEPIPELYASKQPKEPTPEEVDSRRVRLQGSPTAVIGSPLNCIK